MKDRLMLATLLEFARDMLAMLFRALFPDRARDRLEDDERRPDAPLIPPIALAEDPKMSARPLRKLPSPSLPADTSSRSRSGSSFVGS
jgi:hypothetical protein